MSDEMVYCSFCNKSPDEVDTVIAGVTANICNDCVALCNEILNSNREICSCGAVDRASADNDLPIEYNSDQKRYYINGPGHNKLSFYHCFACGGTLTDRSAINRSNFQSQDDGFEKIDNRELVQISALIKPAKSIAEMITILGEPDQILLSPIVHNQKDKEIYHYKDVLKSASFSKKFQTVNVIAQEMEDGEFQISYIGKLKAE